MDDREMAAALAEAITEGLPPFYRSKVRDGALTPEEAWAEYDGWRQAQMRDVAAALAAGGMAHTEAWVRAHFDLRGD